MMIRLSKIRPGLAALRGAHVGQIAIQPDLEIGESVVAEGFNYLAGFGVESRQIAARGKEQTAV